MTAPWAFWKVLLCLSPHFFLLQAKCTYCLPLFLIGLVFHTLATFIPISLHFSWNLAPKTGHNTPMGWKYYFPWLWDHGFIHPFCRCITLLTPVQLPTDCNPDILYYCQSKYSPSYVCAFVCLTKCHTFLLKFILLISIALPLPHGCSKEAPLYTFRQLLNICFVIANGLRESCSCLIMFINLQYTVS